MSGSVFQFKEFEIFQENTTLKVGTDAMVFGSLINAENKRSALDIGAGTGVLSLMLAQKNPELLIEAIEIEAGAAKDCDFNFQNTPWKNRLKLHQADFLNHDFEKQFDLIVSNPPFYANGLLSASPNVNLSKHNKALPFDLLFKKSASYLTASGEFWVIAPYEQGDILKKLAQPLEWHLCSEIMVFAKPDRPSRLILSFSPSLKEKVCFELLIREASGGYSAQYKVLTQDFHGIKLN
jgi:tRNA1Val (adenine37-N6)-methyltransferase